MWPFLIGIIATAKHLVFPLGPGITTHRGGCGKLLISIISNLDERSLFQLIETFTLYFLDFFFIL